MLAIISTVSDSLLQAEEKVTGTDFQGTVSAIAAMDSAIDQLPSDRSDLGNGMVCRLLRKEASVLRSRFHARLRRLLLQCVTIERGRILVTKQLKGVVRDERVLLVDPVSISDVLQSLLAVGKAQGVLNEIMMSIWQELLKPLWREKKITTPRIYSSVDSDYSELIYESIYKESGSSLLPDGNQRSIIL